MLGSRKRASFVLNSRETDRFRPDIQGLRAVAVVAVVLNHAGIPFVSGGYVGVDVFFVISGFLITSHLLRSLERDNRIHFGAFYARRARRILPASFTVLAASIAGAYFFVPPVLREQVFRDAVATALYVPNYAFAIQGTDYLADSAPSVFQHYWSLGVEEQFYLLWPLLLLAAFVLTRGSRRALVVALAVVVVGSFIVCVLLTYSSQPWAFFSLWSRAWELGIGGLVAVVPVAGARRMPAAIAGTLGWIGVAGILVASILFSASTAFPGSAAALPVASAALVIFAGGTPSRFGPLLVLGLRPVQFLGLISYSLYLVHWPILILTEDAVGTYVTLSVWATTGLALAAVPIAWALYRWIENPARDSTWLTRRSWRPLVAAGVGSLVLALVASTGASATTGLPLNSGRAAAASTPTDPPIATAFVPSNLRPSLQRAADDNPALYADGCEVGFAQTVPGPCYLGDPKGKRIVLFGDSHAAQWYPALAAIAKNEGYRLETQTKSACPSVDIEIARNGVDYKACDVWRDNVLRDLKSDPPALVIIANYDNPDFNDSSNTSDQWAAGMRSTLGQLTAVTKVAVIADTPDFRVSPIVCLSAHLTSAVDCARPATTVLKSPGRVPSADPSNLSGATFIDLTGYFCTTSCPPIIGATMVYRDSHHLSATFAASLAPVLEPRIDELLGSGSTPNKTGG